MAESDFVSVSPRIGSKLFEGRKKDADIEKVLGGNKSSISNRIKNMKHEKTNEESQAETNKSSVYGSTNTWLVICLVIIIIVLLIFLVWYYIEYNKTQNNPAGAGERKYTNYPIPREVIESQNNRLQQENISNYELDNVMNKLQQAQPAHPQLPPAHSQQQQAPAQPHPPQQQQQAPAHPHPQQAPAHPHPQQAPPQSNYSPEQQQLQQQYLKQKKNSKLPTIPEESQLDIIQQHSEESTQALRIEEEGSDYDSDSYEDNDIEDDEEDAEEQYE
jgi:FtsZ-interacting cell division protein ZipA